MQHVMRKIWIAMCFLAPVAALGQYAVTADPQTNPQVKSAPMQVPMVIEPADADAFRDIIETTIPPRYNGALIRWYTAILQRQQAKQAEAAKQVQDK